MKTLKARADLTIGGLARALDRAARPEHHQPLLKVGPRPASLRDGDVVILMAQGNHLVAIPFARTSPGPSAPFTELERRALKGIGFDPDAPGDDHGVVEESAKAYALLLAQSYTVVQVARMLRTDRSRVRQRLGGPRRSLYGIKVGAEWLIPRFQFEGNGVIPGFAEVVRHLALDLHPLSVEGWLTNTDADLEEEEGGRTMTPLEWLRSGRPTAPLVAQAKEL